MGFTIFKHEKMGLSDISESAAEALSPCVEGGQLLHLWDKCGVIFAVVKHNNEIHFLRVIGMLSAGWNVVQDQVVNFGGQ